MHGYRRYKLEQFDNKVILERTSRNIRKKLTKATTNIAQKTINYKAEFVISKDKLIHSFLHSTI